MIAYIVKSWKKSIGDRVITITNLTPDLFAEEKQKYKREIEQKLYDVFHKYIS